MRILAVSGRPPKRGGRGDQTRLHALLAELSARHDVTVIATENADHDPALDSVRSVVVEAGRARRTLAVPGALIRGQPGQTGWLMPGRAWRAVLELARDADVVLAMTSRSVRGPLPAPLVMDHVDSLSYNMARRARGAEPVPRRVAARLEAWRLRAWEARVAGYATAQIATSEEVAELLPREPAPAVIPVAWEGPVFEDPPGHVRDIDVIFTGDMSYPPNAAGARRLTQEILPIVRRRRECSTWIVGRAAERVAAGGVEIAADVPDLHHYLRRAKVAVAPILGKGSPFKTLEAAANGAAVVGPAWTVDCYGLDAWTAETTGEFADGIVSLLADDERRARQVATARTAVERHSSARIARRFELVLAEAADRGRTSRTRSPPRQAFR